MNTDNPRVLLLEHEGLRARTWLNWKNVQRDLHKCN